MFTYQVTDGFGFPYAKQFSIAVDPKDHTEFSTARGSSRMVAEIINFDFKKPYWVIKYWYYFMMWWCKYIWIELSPGICFSRASSTARVTRASAGRPLPLSAKTVYNPSSLRSTPIIYGNQCFEHYHTIYIWYTKFFQYGF